jgi:branched-chain amino acid transport system permease protein
MNVQLIFNAFTSGLLLALVAVGFNLIFSTTRVFHLAHAFFYVLGAYVLIEFKGQTNASVVVFIPAILAAIIVVAIVAALTEVMIYQPLAKRGAGQAITLISSLGIYIFLVNLVAVLFTTESKFTSQNTGKSIVLGDLLIVPVQIVQLSVGAGLLFALFFFTKSRLFLKIRAVSSQEAVAAILGIRISRIRLFAIICGSVLAAVAGGLKFYDSGISPYAGMTITLSAIVAAIIGGNASIGGTVAAAFMIALLQAVTEYFLSPQWKDCVTFLLLIVVILCKTEGIVSFKMRIEEK